MAMPIRGLQSGRDSLIVVVGTALLASCGGSNSSTPPAPPPTPQYTVGGSVSGLVGSGLVLQNNGGNDLAIKANGSFAFSTAVNSGSAYAVTVKTQPTNPSQTCVLSGGNGTIAGANVSNVVATCTIQSFTVGGAVGGLIGSGLVLQNNGGNDLAIAANGSFAFSAAVDSASGYAVTIKAQPTNPSQTCVLSGVTERSLPRMSRVLWRRARSRPADSYMWRVRMGSSVTR
jgi:hypothetical protein